MSKAIDTFVKKVVSSLTTEDRLLLFGNKSVIRPRDVMRYIVLDVMYGHDTREVQRHAARLARVARAMRVPPLEQQPWVHLLTNIEGVKVVQHGELSPLACCKLDVKTWNKMGFTQLRVKSGSPKRNGRIWNHTIHDVTSPQMPLDTFVATSIEKRPSDLCVFHGSSNMYQEALQHKIEALGNGAMGTGFYVTTNPGEARGYACESALDYYSQDHWCIILEIVISDAHELVEGDDFTHNARLGFENQFVIRRKALDRLQIRRIHVIPRSAMMTSGIIDDHKIQECGAIR